MCDIQVTSGTSKHVTQLWQQCQPHMDPPGASWGSRTCCWTLGWPRSMSKGSHDTEGTGTGSGPPLAHWLPAGTWGQSKGEMGFSNFSSLPLLWRNFLEESLSYCWPWQWDLPQQVNIAWTSGASQVPAEPFLFTSMLWRELSFQGPEFPHFLPLSCKQCHMDSYFSG